MAECSECGKQTMSFTCHYCGKKFCSEHRLPENHDCDGLDSGKKDEYLHKVDSGKEDKNKDEDTQKWFKDKSPKKEVKRAGHQRTFTQDVKDTLKSNYTLSIIFFTVGMYFLTNIFPALGSIFTLVPALTQQAANAAGYNQTLLSQPWSIITVMIVHGGLFHLFANMVTFYFFGSTLERTIGSKKLLKYYIGTGVLASFGYIAFSNLVYLIHGATLPGSQLSTLSPAVGASGAVIAIVGMVAVLYPEAEVLLYFVFPMKIKTAVQAFAVLELFNMGAKLAGVSLPLLGGLASSAHLTGLIVGVILGKKLKENYGRKARIDIFR